MTSWIATDRRRFPRLICRAAVQYRDFLQPGGFRAGGLSKDLSAGGLRFQAAQFVAHQHRFLVHLIVPGVPTPIRTIAQVCWTRKQPHSDAYDVGARFVEITPHDRGRLADYVERGIRLVPGTR